MIFPFSKIFSLALRPVQPPIERVPTSVSMQVKWYGCEADKSLQSKAAVCCANLHFPYTCILGCFIKYTNNLKLYLSFYILFSNYSKWESIVSSVFKHNILKTGSCSVIRHMRKKVFYSVGPTPNSWLQSLDHNTP